MDAQQLEDLNLSLKDLTKQIRTHKGTPQSLRRLQDRRILVFKQIHEETHRARAEKLIHARALAHLKSNPALTEREAFAVQVAVELFHGVPEEEIEYAMRQAVNLRH